MQTGSPFKKTLLIQTKAVIPFVNENTENYEPFR